LVIIPSILFARHKFIREFHFRQKEDQNDIAHVVADAGKKTNLAGNYDVVQQSDVAVGDVVLLYEIEPTVITTPQKVNHYDKLKKQKFREGLILSIESAGFSKRNPFKDRFTLDSFNATFETFRVNMLVNNKPEHIYIFIYEHLLLSKKTS
jgi:hypothetical protein